MMLQSKTQCFLMSADEAEQPACQVHTDLGFHKHKQQTQTQLKVVCSRFRGIYLTA